MRSQVFVALAVLSGAAAVARAEGIDADSERVFRERVLPIFRSPDPSSCVECHLAAVDLKDYLRPTADETFLSLRDQGLVDAREPAKSKILTMIRMAPEKPAPLPSRRRAEEAAAFEAWILASAARADLVVAPPLDAAKRAAPKRPVEVIRHARLDRVLERFRESFWPDAERCASCHAPPQNAKQEKQYGERVSWMVRDDPAATLENLRRRGLFDTAAPEKSLVLEKPSERVPHVGGRKIVVGDETWTRWLAFLRDHAKAVKDGYATEKDLPSPTPDVDVATDCWVRVETPSSLEKSAVSIEVLAWDADTKAFAEKPVATAVREAGKQGWQQTLYLHAPRDSDLAAAQAREKTLPKGRYLVRVYADPSYDPKKAKGARLFGGKKIGEVDVTREWPVGYGSMNKLGPVPPK